ncbi:radical SAM protein [Pelomyxa schiedti]|nr:radical SAM protein [Pelomyxa schiedti]
MGNTATTDAQPPPKRQPCVLCGTVAVPAVLGVCRNCIMTNESNAREVWTMRRGAMGLIPGGCHNSPAASPSLNHESPAAESVGAGDGGGRTEVEEVHSNCAASGAHCGWCSQNCTIEEGEKGFCQLRTCSRGKVRGVLEPDPSSENVSAVVNWYDDPMPVNCCSDWVCPLCVEPDKNLTNLAVFYGGCAFACAYCQNPKHRDMASAAQPRHTSQDLLEAVHPTTPCVCYFGGDFGPSWKHALQSAQRVYQKSVDENRPIRICIETNGGLKWPILSKLADFCLKSGGCIKVDLKAWHSSINEALCGVSNQQTLENFRKLYEYGELRRQQFRQQQENPEPQQPPTHRLMPFLTASTLMVPGYVEAEEVSHIAKFIASIDPDIPYALLGFLPLFKMQDSKRVTVAEAEACVSAAHAAGLTNVRLQNRAVLEPDKPNLF